MAGERIVIVDDDEQVASYVNITFSLSGYSVHWIQDGRKAVKEIQNLLPQAVILDLKMPGITGFRICEELRLDARTRGIPVIVVSGSWKNAEDRIKSIEKGADDFLTKPFDAQELMARIRRMLDRKKLDMGHNPLTGLPGNSAIEEEARRRLATRRDQAYAYIDLDNFKAYNDVYGARQGDKVIRLLSDLLIQAVKRSGNADDFIGHIGGDDFIVMTSADKAQSVFESIAQRFDERIHAYYSDADLKAGFITAKDREGQIRKFHFMSVSIVYLTDTHFQSSQYSVLIQSLTEMKSYVKHNMERKGGSVVFQDRRTNPAPPSKGSMDRRSQDQGNADAAVNF